MDMLRLSVVLTIVIYSITVSCFDSRDSMKTTSVSLEQSPGNQDDRFPNDYTIWFNHDGDTVYYDLVRDDQRMNVISPDIAQYIPFLPKDLMNDDNQHEFAYYLEENDEIPREGSFFIFHRPNPTLPARIYGQMINNGNSYTVMASGNGNEHTVTHEYALSNEGHRAKRAVGLHVIEVIVWYGPDFYEFHNDRLGDMALLTTFLTNYPISVLRDVNVIFSQISSMTLKVYFRDSGGDTDLTVAWHQDSISGSGYMPINSVSSALVSYLDTQSLIDTDHTVVLTRADLANNGAGSGKFKIAGGNGNICTSTRSVGIAETFGPDSTRAIAQAIAFGFSSIAINWGALDYTIMDDLKWIFPIPVAYKQNIWSWDSTAESRFETDVDSFSSNCLVLHNSGFDLQAFLAENSIGEAYTMDEQCDILYGTSTFTSTVCANFDGANLCFEEVLCDTESAGCSGNIVPGDKTLCSALKYQFEYGCKLSECNYQLTNTTTTSTTTSSTTSTSTTSTTSTTSSTTSSTMSTTTHSTTSSSTTSPSPTTTTTEEGLQTTTTEPDNTMIPSSPRPLDCCCEKRPLGQVKINIEYIPCPEENMMGYR